MFWCLCFTCTLCQTSGNGHSRTSFLFRVIPLFPNEHVLSFQFSRDPVGKWSRDNDLSVCGDGGAICRCGRHTDVKRNDRRFSHFILRKESVRKETGRLDMLVATRTHLSVVTKASPNVIHSTSYVLE
jgi:hypothetical protein